MAQFYATVKGTKRARDATCQGGKDTGILASVKSYQGQVNVYLYHREGVDYAMVTLAPHSTGKEKDKTVGPVRLLYDGPCGAWNAWPQELVA